MENEKTVEDMVNYLREALKSSRTISPLASFYLGALNGRLILQEAELSSLRERVRTLEEQNT